MTKKLVAVTLVLLLLISCSSNKGPVSDKNDDYWDPNLKNKIEKARNEGGGIFVNIAKKDTNTSVDFAKSNVLWKCRFIYNYGSRWAFLLQEGV